MKFSRFEVSMLRLVAITDPQPRDIGSVLERCRAAVAGGATMIQLRMKGAKARYLVEAARALVEVLPVPLIVNDRVDVALAAGAAGAHLGVDDPPVYALRAIVPDGFILGASVGSEEEIPNALHADYVGIGPAFATATKGDAGTPLGAGGVALLRTQCRKPAVAIGGIDRGNVHDLRGAGVAGVAVVSAIFGADDIEREAMQIRAGVESWFEGQ